MAGFTRQLEERRSRAARYSKRVFEELDRTGSVSFTLLEDLAVDEEDERCCSNHAEALRLWQSIEAETGSHMPESVLYHAAPTLAAALSLPPNRADCRWCMLTLR